MIFTEGLPIDLTKWNIDQSLNGLHINLIAETLLSYSGRSCPDFEPPSQRPTKRILLDAFWV